MHGSQVIRTLYGPIKGKARFSGLPGGTVERDEDIGNIVYFEPASG